MKLTAAPPLVDPRRDSITDWIEHQDRIDRMVRELGEALMPAGVPELLKLAGMKVTFHQGGWHQGARRKAKWTIYKPGAALSAEIVREGDPIEAWQEAIGRALDAFQVREAEDNA